MLMYPVVASTIFLHTILYLVPGTEIFTDISIPGTSTGTSTGTSFLFLKNQKVFLPTSYPSYNYDGFSLLPA